MYFSGMKRIYWLPYCTTSLAIVKEYELDKKGFEFQDIKTEKITEDQINEMYRLAGSYAKLFSKRALKFRGWGLHEKELTEEDYRKYILEEYTFLRRPVIIYGDRIFIGMDKSLKKMKW